MNANDILDLIGEAKDAHVWDAQVVRSGAVFNGTKRHTMKRTLLIAATVTLMLLLVGCTVGYVRGWFADFFGKKSDIPLSESQIALIERNEQKINEGKTENGWTVELRSTMKMGDCAYIIIGITAPETVNLEPRVKDDHLLDTFTPGNSGMTGAMNGGQELVTCSDGVFLSSILTTWEEDGDGFDNTKNYVIKIYPDLGKSTIDPFGPDAQYSIYMEDIVREYEDEEYRQELLDTKYKGDYGVMFTPEETRRISQREVLAEGIWSFSVVFAEGNSGLLEMELLTRPIPVGAEMWMRYGEGIADSVMVRKDVTVTSILLQPLSATVTYEPCGGWPSFCFDDGDLDRSDTIYVSCVLRDDTRILLRDMGNGGDGYKVLDAEIPIVLDEVKYIQLPDGTKVHTDGTVEFAIKESQPEAAQKYRGIASATGCYAYYSDFNGDSIEDLAVWYDGAFHALYLLDETGGIKTEITFENGADIYETYNQRAESISHEPNQIRITETENGIETIRYYQVTETGLQMRAGIRKDTAGGKTQWYQSAPEASVPHDPAKEIWEPVSEETYRRIAEDYQVMEFRLIPIQ